MPSCTNGLSCSCARTSSLLDTPGVMLCQHGAAQGASVTKLSSSSRSSRVHPPTAQAVILNTTSARPTLILMQDVFPVTAILPILTSNELLAAATLATGESMADIHSRRKSSTDPSPPLPAHPVKSNDNVTEGGCFCQKIMLPGCRLLSGFVLQASLSSIRRAVEKWGTRSVAESCPLLHSLFFGYP